MHLNVSKVVNIAQVVFILLGGFLFAMKNDYNLINMSLEGLVSYVIAASAIPMSLALIISGFYPKVIERLNGVAIYFPLMGIILIFVSIKTLFT